VPPAPVTPAPVPTILDVDTGVDDALALMLACASPQLELLAVTCVAGNTLLPDVVTNTRTVLVYCDRADVPVAAGAERALLRASSSVADARVHGGAGRGYVSIPSDLTPTATQHAAELIVDRARARPGEITLITTGPLTNLALALQLEPRLPELLGRWIFMGGAYGTERGNTTPAAEFNIHADPEAAQIAIAAFNAAPTRPLGVGLDVTHQLRLMPHHIEDLAAHAGQPLLVCDDGRPWGQPTSPLLSYLVGALRKYAEYHQEQHGFYGVYLHDPLTVAIAIDPTVVTHRAVAVAVECQGNLTTGQSVADWQGVWGRPANVDVAVAIDAQKIFTSIVTAIGDLIRADQRVSAVAAPPPPPRVS
jgi:purine nucleosidase